MTDRDFLIWLHQRLVLVHGESELLDYMWKLRAIIEATPRDRNTPNCGVSYIEALIVDSVWADQEEITVIRSSEQSQPCPPSACPNPEPSEPSPKQSPTPRT